MAEYEILIEAFLHTYMLFPNSNLLALENLRGWKRVGEWREGRIKKEEPFSLLLVHDKRICLESYTDHFLCIHSGFNIGVIFLDLIS
uniref:Putative ovule protein n=1 Tax=Solanum chacoense TaxID=4108 RepID=A0A0V0GPB1_SOLCH